MTDKPHIMIVEARFYEDLADELVRGAIAEIEKDGATYQRVSVPGCLEIRAGRLYALRSKDYYT
ncbi:6,7-dimethyl-8-ribityllumazine synthase, partial [Sabulibacter ruber]|uniref:6,7-dimethyl-8-ribityllumazine synthase n=1 Tax=Sabulibacter ruber TaxID=2811901 RepID=UPI001A960FC5